MRFELAITMDNAAFWDSPADETARILRDVAGRVERGEWSADPANVRDYNGNIVGTFVVREG